MVDPVGQADEQEDGADDHLGHDVKDWGGVEGGVEMRFDIEGICEENMKIQLPEGRRHRHRWSTPPPCCPRPPPGCCPPAPSCPPPSPCCSPRTPLPSLSSPPPPPCIAPACPTSRQQLMWSLIQMYFSNNYTIGFFQNCSNISSKIFWVINFFSWPNCVWDRSVPTLNLHTFPSKYLPLKHSIRKDIVIFQTSDQSDEGIWPDQSNGNDQDLPFNFQMLVFQTTEKINSWQW